MGRTELIIAIVILVANAIIGMIAKKQKEARKAKRTEQGGDASRDDADDFFDEDDENEAEEEKTRPAPVGNRPAGRGEYGVFLPSPPPPVPPMPTSGRGRATPPRTPPVGPGPVRLPGGIVIREFPPPVTSAPPAASHHGRVTGEGRRLGSGSQGQGGSSARSVQSGANRIRRSSERAARELARKRERDRRRAERDARMLARKAAAKIRTDRGMASRAVRIVRKDPEQALSPLARMLRSKLRERDTARLAFLGAEIFGRPRSEQ